jgi:hypothetical protein
MISKSAFTALTIFLASVACHAASPDARAAQVKAAFENVAPGRPFHADRLVFGDLDGDGIEDVATFLGDDYYNDNGVENLQVLVFGGKKNGTFELIARSADFPGHERLSYALSIEHGSLFVHRDGADGCCAHSAADFQFKRRDGQLMLIGLATATFHPEGVNLPDKGVSINLVTAQAETWTGSGKNAKRQRGNVSGLRPVPFAGFDSEAFTSRWTALLWPPGQN